MRRFFLAALIALLVGVGLVALIETDPGYVLISYSLLTIESSIWVALVLLVLLNTLAFYLFRLVQGLLASRGSLSDWLQNRRLEKGRKLTAQGVLSYFRGDWRRARRTLLQSLNQSPQPEVNYLLAAQSSAHLGETDRADEYYLELQNGAAADPLLVAISRASDYLHAGDHLSAVDALASVRDQAASNPLVLTLLKDAFYGNGDWRALIALLPQLKKHKIMDAQSCQALAIESYCALLKAAADETELAQAWAEISADMRLTPEILAAYGYALLRFGLATDLEKQLIKALKRQWHPDLVRLFGLIQGADANRQLQRAESWLRERSEDAELLLSLGRLSLRNQLWGQARGYFESSYRQRPSAETCAELARLLFSLGEREKSARFYRAGLLANTGQLPDLPLPNLSLSNLPLPK